jgi:hypothetical protein
MAKESMKAREVKRENGSKVCWEKKALLEAGDFVGLQKLPKTLLHLVYITDVKLQVDLEVTCVNLVFHVLHSVN